MNKVVVFFAEGFEEIEGLTVVDLLRRAGIQVEMVTIKEDSLFVTGAHKIQIKADTYAKDVDYSNVDMVVLPGGMPGTLNLGSCKLVTDTVMDFYKAGKCYLCCTKYFGGFRNHGRKTRRVLSGI